jgi:hypothetical protein
LYFALAIYRLSHAPETEVTPPNPSPVSEPPAGRNDSQRALSEIRLAIQYATGAMSVAGAEAELPRMQAALLTANKQFGIDMVTHHADARIALEQGRRVLREIYPLLRSGHIEEARLAGNERVANYNNPAA